MELQQIKGNCSLWSLSGNDASVSMHTFAQFRIDLQQLIANTAYVDRRHYIMLVTNRRFNFFKKSKIKSYRRLGFKVMKSYKKNTTIMVASVHDIMSK